MIKAPTIAFSDWFPLAFPLVIIFEDIFTNFRWPEGWRGFLNIALLILNIEKHPLHVWLEHIWA